jgi:hypothetical protein
LISQIAKLGLEIQSSTRSELAAFSADGYDADRDRLRIHEAGNRAVYVGD